MAPAHSGSSLSRCWPRYHTCRAALQSRTIGRLMFTCSSSTRGFPFTNLAPVSAFRSATADSRTLPRCLRPVSAGITGDVGMKTTSRSWRLICAIKHFLRLLADFTRRSWSRIISDLVQINAEMLNRVGGLVQRPTTVLCTCSLEARGDAMRARHSLNITRSGGQGGKSKGKYYKHRLGLRSVEGFKLMLWLLYYQTRKRTQFTK